nr:hypothetical protein [uncultured Cellulosilyticum sp.]
MSHCCGEHHAKESSRHGSGLRELERNVHNIEGISCNIYWTVQQMYAQATSIEGALNNPVYGLQQLNTNVLNIQSTLQDSETGLAAVNSELSSLRETVAELQQSVEYIIMLLES